jgi:hypothetical protein
MSGALRLVKAGSKPISEKLHVDISRWLSYKYLVLGREVVR